MPTKNILAWLEKQDPKKHKEELENAYKCADEVQYRKGYQDAKREFEKQGEQNHKEKVDEAMREIEEKARVFSNKHKGESSDEILEQMRGEQKPDTDFSNLRTWKYIVDAVWTEKEGIGQYLDSPFTEETAKKLQKRFGNIEQKPAEDSCKISDDITTEEKDMTEYKKGFECGKQRVLKYPEEFNLCEKSASAWSEEDEMILETVLDKIGDLGTGEICKDWLKSLKERMKGE